MSGICDECECANEDQDKIILLEKVIKAQARLLVAYRTGAKPPEWVFKTLDRARKFGIEC